MSLQTTKAKNSAGSIIAVTCVLSLGYAVLRYHVMGPVPWKDFPFFIINKGIALGAFILLTFNYGFGPLKNLGVNVPTGWLTARKALGMTGFLLVLIHTLISFLLFNPAVYEKFFLENGTLTLLAGLSMLGGVLSFVVLWGYNLSFQTHLREDQAFIRFITSRRFVVRHVAGSCSFIFYGLPGVDGPCRLAWGITSS